MFGKIVGDCYSSYFIALDAFKGTLSRLTAKNVRFLFSGHLTILTWGIEGPLKELDFD